MIDLNIGRDGTDWSGAFIYRLEKRKPQILIINYRKQGRTSLKIAGGTCLPGQHPCDALGNEITQELGLELILPSKVYFVWTNEKVPGKHHQHFFATPFTNLEGNMRRTSMKDGDETLGPPYWMDVEEALKVLFYSHLQGLRRALPVIAEMDQEFCMAVSHLL